MAYSIYVDKRPARTAFLLNLETDFGRIPDIFKYCTGKWGGRLWPIILTDNKSISPEWWKFLRTFDPDFLYSLSLVEDGLLEKVSHNLTPIEFISDNSQNNFIQENQYLISIFPTTEIINKIAKKFRGNANLVVFDISKTDSEIIKKFLSYNFMACEEEHEIRAIKERCPTVSIFKIEGWASLNEVLMELSKFGMSYVYPIQLSGFSNHGNETDYKDANQQFTAIVGDTAQELIYFWNRSSFVPRWLRASITHLWIPTEVAENNIIEPGLKEWLSRYSHSIPNHQFLRVESFSLEESRLKQIFDRLRDSAPATFSVLTSQPIPNFRDWPFINPPEDADMYRGYGDEEQIVLKEPDIPEGVMGGEHWMADMYVEFRPERFSHIIGGSHWWQLPQRNTLIQGVFNKPARITYDGIFSVLMQRNSFAKQGETKLRITLPDDETVIKLLICGEDRPVYRGDLRKKFSKRQLDWPRLSNQGQYLDGVIKLFGSLDDANEFFSRRYWRRMFDVLSNKKGSTEILYREMIKNKLGKSAPSFKSIDELIDTSTDILMRLASELRRNTNAISYETFKNEAEKEIHDHNQSQAPDKQFLFDDNTAKELKRELRVLLKHNIIFLGIKPHCPHCGSNNWLPIEQVKQKVTCIGCHHEFGIEPEERWMYELNSLISAAYGKYGITPVILTNGQLYDDARHCFIFSPSLEIRIEGSSETFSDLDITCVKDGKFIIGEVKEVCSLFKENDFKKMGHIAKLIRPNKVIFSSMDKEPDLITKQRIEELKKDLEPFNIEVGWYAFHHWNYEPSPHF